MPFTGFTTPAEVPLRSDPQDDFAGTAEDFLIWMVVLRNELVTCLSELETAAALINAAPAYADAGLVSIANLNIAADEMLYGSAADMFSKTALTAVARTLLAQSSQANMRTTGLGFSANGSSLVSAANYATMRTLLGLAIGSDVQAYDAELAAIAGLVSAANKLPMFSGPGAATLIDFKDEDDMSSNSATAVPSQQSVKAYVDAQTIASSGGTSSSGYEDFDIGSLGTMRRCWGSNSIGANTSTLITMPASFSTAIGGSAGMETSDTTLSDFSTAYLASTTQIRLTNGTSGSLTFQWFAWGIV